MYQNNIFFYFFKIIFDISASKRSKNTKKYINLKQKKKSFQIFSIGAQWPLEFFFLTTGCLLNYIKLNRNNNEYDVIIYI